MFDLSDCSFDVKFDTKQKTTEQLYDVATRLSNLLYQTTYEDATANKRIIKQNDELKGASVSVFIPNVYTRGTLDDKSKEYFYFIINHVFFMKTYMETKVSTHFVDLPS
jgi:hypothetical protein